MYDLVHLVLDAVLGIITLLVLLRHDVLTYLLRRRVMQKCWEEVLGVRILFSDNPDGEWTWDCPELDTKQDDTLRFRSMHAARMAAAAVIYAFFVMEEETSSSVPPTIRRLPADPTAGESGPLSPPHGGGGDK